MTASMRALGPALAGILAVTVPIAAHASGPSSTMTPVNAGPAPGIMLVWDGGGSSQPVRAIGAHPTAGHMRQWNGGWVRRIGGPGVRPLDGVRMAGRASRPTGSGGPAAAPLIIPSLIGAVRQAGGVIRSPASAWMPWARANVLGTADSSLSMRASTRDSALSQRDERFLEVWDKQRADCQEGVCTGRAII